MSANSLASASPASTVAQLLHIGTGSLAAGAPLYLGDGSTTILTLSNAGLTVAGTLTATTLSAANATLSATLTANNLVVKGSASAGITLTRLGTVARSQALADAPGTLHPVIRAVVAATAINGTTTAAAVTLSWENGSALPAGTYRVRGMFVCQSILTTTGVQLTLNGPSAQTAAMFLEWFQNGVAGAAVAAWGTAYAATSAPVATTPFLQNVEGLLTLSADSATVPTLMLTAEVAGTNAVQVNAGSFIEFERIL